jgi:hypothetical protein
MSATAGFATRKWRRRAPAGGGRLAMRARRSDRPARKAVAASNRQSAIQTGCA